MKEFKKLFDFTDFTHLKNNVDVSLNNIKQLNPTLNAFCNVYEEEFKFNSTKVSENINSKKNKDLAGLIIGIKDLFCYKDHPVQAASKILDKFISPYNATVVERILNNDGLIVGHQNCDEFGMGSSNEHSIYGCVHNYFDYNKTSGGSSGGSAVAVQTDMCHISLGTDTGGSIRQPAAFCGVIGFKPSYGVISRYGVIAHASSFDTVGILGKSIKDIKIVFKTIMGHDGHDLSMSQELPNETVEEKKKYKIGYLKNALEFEGLQEEIKKSIQNFLGKLQDEQNIIESVEVDFLDYVVPIYYVLTTAEACSNLARYDGVRYGYRTASYSNFEELITKTRSEGFGEEVKKRIMLGNYIFKTREENNYFSKAQQLRIKIKNAFHEIFNNYDFLILPTTTTTAFKINDISNDNEKSYWSDIFTVIASLVGLPAISIPYGVDKNNMPIGLQIIANKNKDFDLLNFLLTKKVMMNLW